MSVLSLGLLLPFGAGALPDRVLAVVQDTAAGTPAKHVSFVHGTTRDVVETLSTTIGEFLIERGIVRQPDDRVSGPAEAPLTDGSTVEYQPAVDVNLIVDGVSRPLRSPAGTVREMLADQQLAIGTHDHLSPAAGTSLGPGLVVKLTRVRSWLERVRSQIAQTVAHKYDITMVPGTQRVIDPGAPGTKETTVAVLQPDGEQTPKRTFLAARVLRFPRTKIIAEGVADSVALGEIARRGFVGTMRLTDSALKMIATAYTAGCSGCSGMTASGHSAGRGVVAVDPRIIPLGSRLFIPGYGRAFAGDTGGSIRGNRIDLGFDSHRDAMTFGRRQIVVYVLK